MSLTLTKVNGAEDVWGRTYTTVYDITYDSSYPLTNGYVINGQDVGLRNLIGAQVIGGNKAAGAVLPMFDFGTPSGVVATSAIARLFLPTGGGSAPATLVAPVAGATVPGAITIAASTATPASGATAVTSTGAQPAIPVTFGTISQAAGTGGALTGGIGLEVGNTTDVSSITVRVRFFGI